MILSDAQRRDLTRIAKAYLQLLALSHRTMSRTRLQPALAALVHEIAELTGSPPETVQNTFEYVAMMLDGEAP